jgi:predicted transcriptional regulator with HTH domain
LYKQLAHYWTYAGVVSPIKLSFAEIRQESGMLERSRVNDAVKELEAIFNNFLDIRVFRSIERIQTVRGARNKIIDIVYEAFPHKDFIKSVKAANRRQADSKEVMGGEANNGYPIKK